MGTVESKRYETALVEGGDYRASRIASGMARYNHQFDEDWNISVLIVANGWGFGPTPYPQLPPLSIQSMHPLYSTLIRGGGDTLFTMFIFMLDVYIPVVHIIPHHPPKTAPTG